MLIKSFNQFIDEEYFNLFQGAPIFVNPSKSEIIEIGKTAEHHSARFLSIASNKSVYVWDADKFIHINVYNFLRKNGVISLKVNFQDYFEIFAGVALIKAGQLIYQSSDELDYYIDNYTKPEYKWQSGAEDDADFLYENVLKMKQNHLFVNKYIKDLDGEDNPFQKIYDLLRKNKTT